MRGLRGVGLTGASLRAFDGSIFAPAASVSSTFRLSTSATVVYFATENLGGPVAFAPATSPLRGASLRGNCLRSGPSLKSILGPTNAANFNLAPTATVIYFATETISSSFTLGGAPPQPTPPIALGARGVGARGLVPRAGRDVTAINVPGVQGATVNPQVSASFGLTITGGTVLPPVIATCSIGSIFGIDFTSVSSQSMSSVFGLSITGEFVYFATMSISSSFTLSPRAKIHHVHQGSPGLVVQPALVGTNSSGSLVVQPALA